VASDQGRQFGLRIQDICQFIDGLEWPSSLAIRPLPLTVCIHSPCSLKNVLRANRHAAALLRRIPELKVVELPAKTQCCGAAGSYMVEHPEMAATLRDDVLDAMAVIKPDLLVTSNPGCAMHLRAGLKKRSHETAEVLHPITLLARHLGS
jgi:glycolate oxidase iron-sulfur subunit